MSSASTVAAVRYVGVLVEAQSSRFSLHDKMSSLQRSADVALFSRFVFFFFLHLVEGKSK